MTPPVNADYRDKVLYALAIAATVVVLPFSLSNLAKGYFWIAALSLAVVAVLDINAYAIYRGRRPPLPMGIAFAFILMGVVIAVWQRGVMTVMWTFPAILLFHFVLERRLANFFNVAMVVAVGAVVYTAVELEFALRIVAGLALTVVFANIFSYAVEVEQRKEMEQQRRLDLLVRAGQAGFFEWERQGDRSTYSPRLKEMLGYPADASTADWPPFSDFIHPEDRPNRIALFKDGARSRGTPGSVLRHVPGQHRLLRAGGETIWVHVEGLFIYGADGRVARYIAAAYDVSELHRKQEELRAAIRVREEVERIARHDLKTPLSSILAVPKILRERRPLDEQESRLLGMVEGAAYRMLGMVNLSIDLYRMEQGEYRFSPRAVDLSALVDTVWSDVHAHARSKNLRLEKRVSGEALAWGEPLLCYSLIANVIKNAVEASPEAGVIGVSIASANQRLQLAVHNAGVVPAEIRQRFFQKYATHGKQGGFGLGAYSARLMARVQNGELAMQTSADSGTTLTLELPAAVAAGAQQASAALPALHVLVVDDDEFNISFMRATLPSPPLVVASAVNGRAALDAAREQPPDVVFMDLEMPVMDGFAALKALRAQEASSGAKRATVVAFSSYDDPGIRQKCLEAGFDAYLAKPAARERIDEILGGKVDAVAVDPDLAATLPGFLDSRRALAASLEQALAAGQREEARAKAHQLAGSLGLYGFRWAAATARRIQAGALEGSLAALRSDGAALREHLEAVKLHPGDGREEEAAASG